MQLPMITGMVDADGKMITLTFDEDLNATDPALANFMVTIGDQSYSGATFIASGERMRRTLSSW